MTCRYTQARRHPPPPPQEPKRSAWWDRKKFKMIQNNVVMVGLSIAVHFQQFEDLKFKFFSGGPYPRIPLKPLQSVHPFQFRRDCPDFAWNSRFSTRLQSRHEYPDFEDQLSQTNEQRNTFLLNYHNICYKMKKPLNLDIQVNSELQSWWMTQELQNKIRLVCSIWGFSSFPALLNQTFHAANLPIHLHLDVVRH